MEVELLLVTLGFALSMIFYISNTRIKKRPKHPLPPGPAGFPLIGCLPEMMINKPTFRWMHNYMQRLNTEIACFRLGVVNAVTITSPELARQFLKEHDAVFASRPDIMSARLVSNGYLSTVLAPAGDQWKKMRRVMVSEVLATAVHEWLHPKRCEEADHLIRYVCNQCRKNGTVNVREAARLYCGGMIRKLMFGDRLLGRGTEDGGPGFEERQHMDALFTILSYTYGFAIADFILCLHWFDLDGHKRVVTNALECLRKYHEPIIHNRVEMWRNGVRNTNQDILDVLISLKDSNNDRLLSIQEIKAQVIEILAAAVDNPSNAVEWALAEMMNEPRLLELATKELDDIVGRKRLVEESDLCELNYSKACIKEAFRLHPVAAFNLPHVSTADTIVGGYMISKGSHVMLSRMGVGRNPRIWEDPLKFKPERHLAVADEDEAVELNDPELRMLSFGSGRRGCPAVKLGSTMTTILLARLIQGFKWRPPSNIHLLESHNDLFMAKPLISGAIPRLEPQVYHRLL
ncbi:isoleucine N-monooxygenase 1-like [Salvia miltiorrhiza]|uniref:isoleucine N-monooxygenase 1-like n=1 Tax=Salvia miltiorrhiza TaxID=226208 RepID=UPI0025AD6DB5|nr:isoleucine N-monooxygenase 1-like [Salvia miltiorrhiza]